MSDPHPARGPEREDKRTFLQKLAEFIHPGPDSAAELIDTLPWGISTRAAGRLVPPNLRGWVAVVQLVALSPLLATIAMFSAFGLLLQARGLVALALESAWQSLPLVRLMVSWGRSRRSTTGLDPWLFAVSIESVAPLRS